MLIEQPAKWLRWLYPRATWRMDPNERSVYITFDDGPIPESTPFILKTLREHNVKATFFMVGENVLRHHDLYNQIIAEGHQVGNHTFNHIGAFKHWAVTYIFNVTQANDIIHAHLFRPPHGWMRHSVYWWLSKKYRIIMWDLVTRQRCCQQCETLHTQWFHHHFPRLTEEHRQVAHRTSRSSHMAKGTRI